MAMEAVILMVRPDIPPATINWEAVRKVMRDANFIPSILEYDAGHYQDFLMSRSVSSRDQCSLFLARIHAVCALCVHIQGRGAAEGPLELEIAIPQSPTSEDHKRLQAWTCCCRMPRGRHSRRSTSKTRPLPSNAARRSKTYMTHCAAGPQGWDVSRIKQASRCAGPVAQWVESQLQFADLLNMMEPMRRRNRTMQIAAEVKK